MEWCWRFSPDTGEAIGGLSAVIEPRAATIKPGDDIVIRAKLLIDSADVPPGGQFARGRGKSVYVWDSKYSNGYRNDAWEVTTPEGAMILLRKPEQLEWRKNIPHPVEIKAGKPYELIGWVDGDTGRSMKNLGLETRKPGKYRITLVYLETGQPVENNHPEMWGGIVRSNTVEIEVK